VDPGKSTSWALLSLRRPRNTGWLIEACSDLADVVQFVLVVGTEEQGSKMLPRAGGFSISADHKLIFLMDLPLCCRIQQLRHRELGFGGEGLQWPLQFVEIGACEPFRS
jgi:hypothetical protein